MRICPDSKEQQVTELGKRRHGLAWILGPGPPLPPSVYRKCFLDFLIVQESPSQGAESKGEGQAAGQESRFSVLRGGPTHTCLDVIHAHT